MSWSFNIPKAADKDAAKAEVDRNAEAAHGHFPSSAQVVVKAVIDALPDCEDSVINVQSNGHFQSGPYRGTSSIMINVSNQFADKPAEQAA